MAAPSTNGSTPVTEGEGEPSREQPSEGTRPVFFDIIADTARSSQEEAPAPTVDAASEQRDFNNGPPAVRFHTPEHQQEPQQRAEAHLVGQQLPSAPPRAPDRHPLAARHQTHGDDRRTRNNPYAMPVEPQRDATFGFRSPDPSSDDHRPQSPWFQRQPAGPGHWQAPPPAYHVGGPPPPPVPVGHRHPHNAGMYSHPDYQGGMRQPPPSRFGEPSPWHRHPGPPAHPSPTLPWQSQVPPGAGPHHPSWRAQWRGPPPPAGYGPTRPPPYPFGRVHAEPHRGPPAGAEYAPQPGYGSVHAWHESAWGPRPSPPHMMPPRYHPPYVPAQQHPAGNSREHSFGSRASDGDPGVHLTLVVGPDWYVGGDAELDYYGTSDDDDGMFMDSDSDDFAVYSDGAGIDTPPPMTRPPGGGMTTWNGVFDNLRRVRQRQLLAPALGRDQSDLWQPVPSPAVSRGSSPNPGARRGNGCRRTAPRRADEQPRAPDVDLLVKGQPGADDAVCPICYEVIHRSCVNVSCGHNFCRVCLERLVRAAQAPFAPMPKCPLCRASLALVVPDIKHRHVVERLRFRCGRSDACRWTGTALEYSAHRCDIAGAVTN